MTLNSEIVCQKDNDEHDAIRDQMRLEYESTTLKERLNDWFKMQDILSQLVEANGWILWLVQHIAIGIFLDQVRTKLCMQNKKYSLALNKNEERSRQIT